MAQALCIHHLVQSSQPPCWLGISVFILWQIIIAKSLRTYSVPGTSRTPGAQPSQQTLQNKCHDYIHFVAVKTKAQRD